MPLSCDPLALVPDDLPANVGILIFDDVEILDFAGPFEVFSVAARIAGPINGAPTPPFQVFTVGEIGSPVTARHGLRIIPQYVFETCPKLDVLIVPGGVVDAPLSSPKTLSWVEQQAVGARDRKSVV